MEDRDSELERIRMEKIRRLLMQKKQANVPPKPEIVQISERNFYQLIKNSDKPMVIDCWAPWCMPCRFIEPIIKDLAMQYAGKIIFGKLNTDENMTLATQLGIQGIPTILLVKNGRIVHRLVGALPRHELEKYIVYYLLS